jgi:hypothetical protein
MTDIALRCYVNNPRERHEAKRQHRSPWTLVLDTETTVDEFQNLLFGSCGLWFKDRMKAFHIFYNDDLKPGEVAVLKAYADEHGYNLLSRSEFVEKVFFPYVFKARAACVGFNLPFDLSRLAISYTNSRIYENGFSFKLTSKPWHPNIIIQHKDSKRSFIQFTKPSHTNKSYKKQPAYRGYFLDLKTLLFALTSRGYSLKNALEDFQCDHRKIETEEHGRITSEYVHYNVNDTLATFELYEKALERYAMYGLDKEPNQLYSPAGIGKAYLKKIGVRPFDEKNPDFPLDVKGYLMTAYYGGRVEVRIRKQPVKVSYLDFTSMYPTLYALLGMDHILKAEHIECITNTGEIQTFLNHVTLTDIPCKDTWQNMACICRLKPDNDVLPIRSRYGNKNVRNIGVNYVKSGTSLWYALPDLIASKLLTGKTPIIDEAITFQAMGIQPDLRSIEVLKGVRLSPDEDFIKKLIEERIHLKKKMKTAKGDEVRQLDLKQGILKIIANSTSYGIFIEVNPADVEEHDVEAYGLKRIETKAQKIELEGMAFNPIMATTITAGARLILAAAEALTLQNGGYYAYCDTDSIFISPDQVNTIQAFFKPLNPYQVEGLDMFKTEDDDHGKPLHDVWFYGISAKRYALYDMDGQIAIRKYSAHGLGENLLGLDQEQFWHDILTMHYHPDQRQWILGKYAYKYAVYDFKASSYALWQRFKVINAGRPIRRQIKPFNFITIGMGYRQNPATKEPIIPMMPHINPKERRFKEIPYRQFIDYKTGEQYPEGTMDTRYYWKPLSEVIHDYMEHPESKSEGDAGLLLRWHVKIDDASIHYIGKESNQLEESETIGVEAANNTIYEDPSFIYNKILALKEEDALKLGISARTLYYWKAKIREGKNINNRLKIFLPVCAQ